jgi:YbbR domain-containing protein
MLLGSEPEIVYPIVLSGGSEGVFRRVRMSHMLSFSEVAERVSLRPGVALVSVQPDSLLLELDRFAQKRVPVIPDYVISFREGYGQTGPAVVVPDSVSLSGAVSVLAGISEWRTAKRTFTDVRTPIDVDVNLSASDLYDVSPSVERVRLTLTVEPFAEKVFTGLGVEITTPPADREVIFLPPKIEVVVRGGIKRLSNLGQKDFRVTVPYETIVADTSGAVDPSVVQPAGVQIVSKKPERVQYIVRKRQ